MNYTTLQEEIHGICALSSYPSKWIRHEICPCCASKKIMYAFSKFSITHSKCRECKFHFVNPYPDEQTSHLLYNSSYYPSVRENVEIPLARKKKSPIASVSMPAEEYFSIAKYIHQKKPHGAWLDVGGGIGSFLAYVRDNYPSYQLFLNEQNVKSADFAKNFYGLNILSQSAQELAEKGKSFDIITIIAVLEHIPNPQEFIKTYSLLLNEGGLMYILVPNYTRLNRLFSKQHSSNVIPPYHLSFFNTQNLKSFFKNNTSLKEIEAWESGDRAFLFEHFTGTSELMDVKIPSSETPKQECIQKRKPSFWKKVLSYFLTKTNIDEHMKPLIVRFDGKMLIHLAGIKKG